MSEITKTACFFGVALLCVGIALGTRSGSVGVEPPDELGKPLFPEFTDPLAAKSLKIVRFDEALSSLSDIEVRESQGIWTLPSHAGYPADAENRVRDAATAFIDLKPLGIQPDDDADPVAFGVVEPGTDKLAVGDEGVGTLVTIKDDGGKNLVNLIIGKQDKDNPALRYVRRPGQSRIYLAEINPENLPVRFDNWIEKDLLKLNSWDINQVVLKDYTFDVSATFTGTRTDYDQKMELVVSDENGTWKLDDLMLGVDGELQPAELGEGEILNQDRLNELRDALDTLEIVDVERKPAGLGADLRVSDGLGSGTEGYASLMQRGFYPVKMGSGETEMLSQDGEVLVRTSEGVEYVLRFGGIEGVDTESDEGKLDRYLMVSARVNESMFPEPELEPLPETIDDLPKEPADEAAEISTATPDQTGATAEAASEAEVANPDVQEVAAPEDATSEDAAPESEAGDAAADKTPDEPTTEEEAVQPDSGTSEAGTDENALVSDTLTAFVQQTEAPVTEELANAADETAETAAGDAVADEAASSSDTVEADAAQAADATGPADASGASPADDPQARLQAERERITKENQRKIDERNDKLENAKKKVDELNFRFADWYYVISEDVYKKIHLNREDITTTEAEAAENGNAGGSPAMPNIPGLPSLPRP